MHGSQARDSRAPERRASEHSDQKDCSVSASRDGGGAPATGKSRETTSDRSKNASASIGAPSRGRSASPHVPRAGQNFM